MNTLASLARKGSLAAFKACLKKRLPAAGELFDAIRAALLWNQPEKAKLLLEMGADPLQVNEENAQLLTHAAIGGNPDLVKLMLTLGCDPNRANRFRRTPLHDAARSGNTAAIAVLVENGADLNCFDTRNRTPLTEAISHNHPEAAIELIRRGAVTNVKTGSEKQSPLMLAASCKSGDLVQLLLSKGSHLEERDAYGCTPLIYAARSGTPEIVEMLLNAGANQRAIDKNGRNAIQWASPLTPEISKLLLKRTSLSPQKATSALLKAAADGHSDTIEHLISKRALIQPKEEGGASALENAVLARSDAALKLLLEQPSLEINYRTGKRLRTALISAARTGIIDRVRMLLEAGADPNIADADGKTAVHHAAGYAHQGLLPILKEHGADLLSRTPGGKSLLHLAIYDTESPTCIESKTETVQWLLDYGLGPNAQDQSDLTPLMLAAGQAFLEIVSMLIEKGAHVNLLDRDGRTALYHAICHGTDYGYNERYVRPKSKKADRVAPVVLKLLESGADPNLCNTLKAARAWRWPGAVSLLKNFGARA